MYADAYLAQTDGPYPTACGRRVPLREPPQTLSMDPVSYTHLDVYKRQPEYTGRLCVIGSKLDEHALEELFGIA